MSDWNGLSSQEQVCRNYAKNILGIEIEKVFNEEGISGGIFERKSIQELFKYIDSNLENNYVVIFDDLNRLSRDIQVHGLLKAEFKKRWVELACPNFQFDESPEWNFKENISVVVSEYERKKNRQRVIDRQQARLEQWFWCFPLPIWYEFQKDERGWKIAVKNKDAKIVKKILEDYASWKIKTANEIIKELHKKGLRVGTIKRWKVYNANLANRMLKNILYTGYLEYSSKWVTLRKAKHEALISMATFKKIQERLLVSPQYITSRINENLNRKDLSEDFPLRGFLHCADSKYMLSWAWSQWAKKKYPYYCFTRYSPNRGISMNRDKFHIEFENFLSKVQLDPYFINSFREILKRIESSKETELQEFQKIQDTKIVDIDSKMSKYIERIGKTDSETLVEWYENKVVELEIEKNEIQKNLSEFKHLVKNVRTPIEKRLKYYESTLQLWKKSDLESRKKLLKEVFPEWIPINKKKQVRTPTFSLIYQIIDVSKWDENKMVDRPGLEPGT